MNNVSKFGLSVMSSLMIGSASANIIPDFMVNESALPGVGLNASGDSRVFEADRMTGGYTERFLVTSFDAATNTGTFATVAYFSIGQFFCCDNSTTPTPGPFGLNRAEDDRGYGLFGTFSATGTFSTVGSTTNFTGGTATFNLFADLDQDTQLSFINPLDPLLGLAALNLANSDANPVDDALLATSSTLIAGAGQVRPLAINLGDYAILFGNIGLDAPPEGLTALGQAYFFDPSPFYMIARASGQLNTFFIPSAESPLNEFSGSLDIIFAAVPEPGMLALFGFGLVGVGFSTRRRKLQ